MKTVKQSDIPGLMARKKQPIIVQDNFKGHQLLSMLALISVEVEEKERIAKQGA